MYRMVSDEPVRCKEKAIEVMAAQIGAAVAEGSLRVVFGTAPDAGASQPQAFIGAVFCMASSCEYDDHEVEVIDSDELAALSNSILPDKSGS